MKIINLHTTKGSNYWSIKRHNLVVMLLDIEALETKPTNEINGFYQSLRQTFPGMIEHRCSEGVKGGFFTRVKRGTWMGHVVEHIALELQTLAGLDVGFGRTRGSGVEGQYYVVFDCEEPQSGRLTAEIAVKMAQQLVDGQKVDVNSNVANIKKVNQKNRPGPSTAAILREAKLRNIPVIQLDDASTWQLGYGCHQQTIAASITSNTSHLAVERSCDKAACKRLFKAMAVPVPEGDLIYDRDELAEVIDDLGFPLVIKPGSGNQGRGVTTNITNLEQATKAFDYASTISDGVIVERHIFGYDYRLLMVNHKMIAAALRTPAHVLGDGHSTLNQLIEKVNIDPRRGDGHEKVLTKIEVCDSIKRMLKTKDCTLNTVLPENEIMYLYHAANLSKGGTAEDVTETLHPQVIKTAERISRIVGLDICGIDLMAPSLDKPLKESGGVVLEINAAPGLRMHLAPSQGTPRRVAAPVVDMLFPNGTPSRVPIIGVTGTNGKTTTTRLISRMFKEAGYKVGTTSTDGIYIDNELIIKGDCGGPKSAEMILRDPTVEAAVLECARGGILREGLAFDHADVGIVTNVTNDHLGIQGIDSLEKMARVKSVIPESVHPNGYAVLNADDDRVYAMKENVTCKVVLFSMDAANARIQTHRANGGICVIYEDGVITVWEDDKTYPVENVENIPLSFGGRAGFMIENILAATAAAYVQKIGLGCIRQALINFRPSPEQTPGRMNVFHFGKFDVMIDYAHNIGGLNAIKNFLDRSDYSHQVGIVAGIGDRRDQDNIALGRLAAEIFDEIIIREDNDLRGKKPGELTEIIRQGITSATPDPNVKTIKSEKQALNYAVAHARENSIIILCTDNITEILDLTKHLQTQQFHKQLKLKTFAPKRLPEPLKKLARGV